MTFDIHQSFFDEDSGEYLEDARFKYQEDLLRLFEESPEAKAFLESDEDAFLHWADSILQFGFDYMEATPPDLSPGDMQELLYHTFPAKLSTPEFDAALAIEEMRAFWRFLKREFSLDNADDCLRVLNESAVRKFDKAMNDPANFGMAKSMFMMGVERGYDMSSEEGVNEWMQILQAESMAGITRVPLPGDTGPEAAETRGRIRGTLRKDRRKRKMAKASRKRNRPQKKKKK